MATTTKPPGVVVVAFGTYIHLIEQCITKLRLLIRNDIHETSSYQQDNQQCDDNCIGRFPGSSCGIRYVDIIFEESVHKLNLSIQERHIRGLLLPG